MDSGLISGAMASVAAAIDIGRNTLAVREGALVSAEVARMNDQLLQAQQALFAHRAELFELQQLHFETSDKLRKAEELLAQRSNYVLVQTGKGQWAYRVNVTPELGAVAQPGLAQAAHYVCQPCLDVRGHLVVLKFSDGMGPPALFCPVCKDHVVAEYLGAEFGF